MITNTLSLRSEATFQTKLIATIILINAIKVSNNLGLNSVFKSLTLTICVARFDKKTPINIILKKIIIFISKTCKNPEKAAEVIKFLVAGDDTTKTEEYFAKAYYSKSSPRKSVQAKIEASLSTQDTVPAEWVSTINSVSEKACLEPIYSWDISVAVEGFLEECAAGEDMEASLKKADEAIKKIIKNEGLANNNPRG